MNIMVGGDQVQEVAQRQLEPRVVSLWRLDALLWWTPVGAGLGAACGWLGERTGPWDSSMIWLLGAAGAFVGGPILSLLLPPIMFRRWSFSLERRELRLRHGVLTHTDTWVPYRRIQYVELRQGLIERRFRLASLVIHTAGSINAQVVLPGQALGHAEELRRSLLSLIEHDRT